MKVIILDELSGNLKEQLATFLDLSDTPASYASFGGKVVAVKTSEDGLEFIDAPSSGGESVGGSLYLYSVCKGVL